MNRLIALMSGLILAGPAAAHTGPVAHVHLSGGIAYPMTGWHATLALIVLVLCVISALTGSDRRKP